MNEMEHYEEINLMDYVEILWKRKWLIIIPTFLITVAIGIWSFMQTPVWEVDAIIQPSKFLSQNTQGEFIEVIVADPKQVAGQINQASYNAIIAAELNIDLRELPNLKAENLRDTNLIRVAIRDVDTNEAVKILNSLFHHLKSEFDRKIDVEMKNIDAQIANKETEIQQKSLNIKSRDLEIQAKKIEKDRIVKEIDSDKKKLEISEERQINLLSEMKSAKSRIDEIDKQLQKALAEKQQIGEALGLLLYSSEVQRNLQYYNALGEKMSAEKVAQETLRMDIRNKEEQLRQLDNQIGQVQNQQESIRNETTILKTDIQLLGQKKSRIDYAQLVKEPTPSLGPVAPRKKMNVLMAGLIGLTIFGFLAFFLEYLEKNKKKIAA
jgi:capsular polysaccharide biosynthesis protein